MWGSEPPEVTLDPALSSAMMTAFMSLLSPSRIPAGVFLCGQCRTLREPFFGNTGRQLAIMRTQRRASVLSLMAG